jgi:hypothetical protein
MCSVLIRLIFSQLTIHNETGFSTENLRISPPPFHHPTSPTIALLPSIPLPLHPPSDGELKTWMQKLKVFSSVPGLLKEKIPSWGKDLKVLHVPGLLKEKMHALEGGFKGSPCSWPPKREKAFIERRV